MKYTIEGEVSFSMTVEAADPDEAVEQFYDALDSQEAGSFEVNKYKVYEL